MPLNVQQFIAKLREKGYKVTPQRLAVFEFIHSREDHPTAEQIHKEVKKEYPTMSLATVYQALHLLTEMGLVQELGFNDKSSRYDPNIMPHINIVCLNCGKIYDYEAESVKEIWSKIIAELRFKPVGQRLDIYRYCDGCSKEKDREF